MGCIFSKVGESKPAKKQYGHQSKEDVKAGPQPQSQLQLLELNQRQKPSQNLVISEEYKTNQNQVEEQGLKREKKITSEKQKESITRQQRINADNTPTQLLANQQKQPRFIQIQGGQNLSQMCEINKINMLTQKVRGPPALYEFQYDQNSPNSLTMVACPQKLIEVLSSLPIYILIEDNHLKLEQKQFEKIIKHLFRPLFHFQTIQAAKDFVLKVKYQSIYVVSPWSQAQTISEQLGNQDKVKQILFYGRNFSEQRVNDKEILRSQSSEVRDDIEQLIKQISQRRNQKCQQSQFVDFVSVQKGFAGNQSIKIRAMYAMVHQETNKKELTEVMIRMLKTAGISEGQALELKKDLMQKPGHKPKMIQWQNNHPFLQRIVNWFLLRAKQPSQIYCLQPYFKQLCQSIQKLHKKSKMRSLTCYHGGFATPTQLDRLTDLIGVVIQNLSFIKAFQKKEVAYQSAVNILFAIEVKQKTKNTFGFADVTLLSSKDQHQIMFNPLNFFVINRKHRAVVHGKNIFVFEFSYVNPYKDEFLEKYQKQMQSIKNFTQIPLSKYQSSIFWKKHIQIFGQNPNDSIWNKPMVQNLQKSIQQDKINHFDTNNQQLDDKMFRFQYLENNPESLTMTNEPAELLRLLITLPLYVLIDDSSRHFSTSQIERISTDLCTQVLCFNTIEAAKKFIALQRNINIHIVCPLSLAIQVEKMFDKERYVKKISCYNDLEEYERLKKVGVLGPKFIRGAQHLSQVFEQIILSRGKDYLKNQYLNFINIRNQVGKSNTLVKIISAMITQQTDTHKLVDEMIQLAKLTGFKKDSHIQQFRQLMHEKSPKQSKIVQWYTKDSFVYPLVNSLMGVATHPSQLFCLQPYFKLLFLAIRKMYKESKLKSFKCFRGGFMGEKELSRLKNKVGQFVQNLGFMSTSFNWEVASRFSSNTIFIIDVNENSYEQSGYAPISQYSIFQDQVEILFNPLNFFEIVSQYPKTVDGKLVQVFEMVFAPQGQNMRILKAYQSQLRFIANIGDVLVENNLNMRGCQQYWEMHRHICVSKRSISRNLLNVGQIHQNKGQYKKALSAYLQIVDKQSTQGKPEFYFQDKEGVQLEREIQMTGELCLYISALFSIGSVYNKIKQHRKSLEYYQKCEQIYKKFIRVNHRNYQTVLNNIALVYLDLGEYQKSLDYYLQCQTMKRNSPQVNYTGYAITLSNIGSVYNKMRKYSLSLEYYKKCEQVQRKLLGVTNLDYLTTLNNIASVYLNLGQHEKSLECFSECEEMQKVLIGEKHPIYALTLCNIASYYEKMGEHQKSISYYLRFQQIQNELEAFNQLDHIKTLSKIGSLYKNLGQYQKSIKYFKKIEDTLTNEKVPQKDYVRIMSEIAQVYDCMGQQNKSLEYYKRCLENSSDRINQSVALSNLAFNYMKLRQYDLSLQCYKNLQEIQRGSLDINDPEYLKTLNNIAVVYYQIAEYRKSLEYFNRCAQIQGKDLQANQSDYKICLQNIALVYQKLEQCLFDM